MGENGRGRERERGGGYFGFPSVQMLGIHKHHILRHFTSRPAPLTRLKHTTAGVHSPYLTCDAPVMTTSSPSVLPSSIACSIATLMVYSSTARAWANLMGPGPMAREERAGGRGEGRAPAFAGCSRPGLRGPMEGEEGRGEEGEGGEEREREGEKGLPRGGAYFFLSEGDRPWIPEDWTVRTIWRERKRAGEGLGGGERGRTLEGLN